MWFDTNGGEGGSSCFKVLGASLPLGWQDAETACQALGYNAHLLTVKQVGAGA